MPTPNDSVIHAPFLHPRRLGHTSHTTCPPDVRDSRSQYDDYAMDGSTESRPMETRQPSDQEPSTHIDSTTDIPTSPKMPGALNIDDREDEFSSSSGEISESSSHDSIETSRPEAELGEQPATSHQNLDPPRDEYENLPPPSDIHGLPRMIPLLTSSFLRPFSKFRGQQQSDKQIYQVEVELKYVDMAESTLCGFLKIEGLTADHPTLTTYFSGEIIGPKYTFQTRHPHWGATEKTDFQHWGRFPAYRPLAKQAKNPHFTYKNFVQRENIFMRWKESFLVPDHKVKEINGASFEGFYYICFNQCSGDINGIYFHAKSEKYQQLELKHVEDRGCFPAMEFR